MDYVVQIVEETDECVTHASASTRCRWAWIGDTKSLLGRTYANRDRQSAQQSDSKPYLPLNPGPYLGAVKRVISQLSADSSSFQHVYVCSALEVA